MSEALRVPDVYDIITQELGPMTLRDADTIAWEFTGFPCFWNIPADGATPEECFRTQLRRLRKDGA
jgi:hypothetical protein